MKYDVVALGELLIDFTQTNIDGHVYYERNAGGAPANMLSMATKLGKKTGLLGAVGTDIFGKFLKTYIEDAGVDTEGLLFSKYPTTFDFVSLDDKGDRSFTFFRNNTADIMMGFEDVRKDIIDECKVFHFGTVTMTAEPARTTTLEAVKYAKEQGKIVSYDPNYRGMLWESYDDAVKIMDEMMALSDIVKISDNEIEMLTNSKDYSLGTEYVLDKGASFAFVTCGADGCYFASKYGEKGYVRGFEVDSVDTTGAGDTFTGSVVSKLIDYGFNPPKGELEKIVLFANAAGAYNTTIRGAIAGMPNIEDIERLLSRGFEK